MVATAQLTFMAGLSHRGMRRAEIEAVRVRADQRGGGIGAALIGWCIDAARQRHCGQVQLASNATRTDARRFYERLGFTASHTGFKLSLDQGLECSQTALRERFGQRVARPIRCVRPTRTDGSESAPYWRSGRGQQW